MEKKQLPQRIFLIGYMGSGKSTIGKKLAKKLNYEFIDLDAFLECKMGKSISTLINGMGEDFFRVQEKKALHEMINYKKVVISTGGGTPCFFDNIDFILKNGTSIYLDIPENILFGRLRNQAANRPLIAHFTSAELRNFIKNHLNSRLPFYKKSHFTILHSRDTKTMVNEIVDVLMC